MGFVGIIKQFFRSQGSPFIKVTEIPGTDRSVGHYTPPGDDSPPMFSDYSAVVSAGGSGSYNSVGYIDKLNEGTANPGEKRLYGRDNNGGIVNELVMYGDGEISLSVGSAFISIFPDETISITNGSGVEITIEQNGSATMRNDSGGVNLDPAGNVNINGVTIDSGGNISTPAQITASVVVGQNSVQGQGKELAVHLHNAGTPPGTTGPNL